MKHRLTPFACISLALFSVALSTCSNPELTTLLKAPSELISLEIAAYAGDVQLEGDAAMEPGFTSAVFRYNVFVSKETDCITVNAAIDGKGTIDIMCEDDQETGTEFDFLDDEKVMILTVQREYMETAQYRVTVIRREPVPTATNVEIGVTPAIGAFFIGRGVIPEFEVKANLPAAGGELSYQWYMNTSNSNRGGSRINGATNTTYRMRQPETMLARTVYYYAEIINTIDGKTGVTESLPCSVTFLDKTELHEKSLAMIDIPAGTVNAGNTTTEEYWGKPQQYSGNFSATFQFQFPWSTPGFSMGQYLVTWELWKYVFDHAEAGNYSFAQIGNQGAEWTNPGLNTNTNPQPVGNELHPVSYISWRDAVVWCNAYSEMDGRQPVYRDSNGEPLRDSRAAVELLFDTTNMDWNGYRLPYSEEWLYAARGADPAGPHWGDAWPGTNDVDELDDYLWGSFIGGQGGSTGTSQPNTAEVGSKLPNSLGLYDMMGMLFQWVGALKEEVDLESKNFVVGTNFLSMSIGPGDNVALAHNVWTYPYLSKDSSVQINIPSGYPTGLRIACSQGGAQ